MNGGIFVHCCPCCFADGVMIRPTPPFCFADGKNVAPLSHLLTGVTTGLYVFHQQVPILTFHKCAAALSFLLMDWARQSGVAQTLLSNVVHPDTWKSSICAPQMQGSMCYHALHVHDPHSWCAPRREISVCVCVSVHYRAWGL